MKLTLQGMILTGVLLSQVGVGFASQKGATLIGHVVFRGAIPPPSEVHVTENADFCGTTMSIQTLKVQHGNHGLHQAVVSVEGLKGNVETAKQITVLNNQQCEFRPRVNAGIQGSRLQVRNEDPILHNTHGKLGKRTLMNVAQVPGGRPVKKKMKRPGIIHLQCDKHQFMKAYMLVFDHQYYAVTDETGEFQIPGIPAGSHHIVVWHETLGKLEQHVTIPAQGTVSIEFEYQ